MVMIVCYTHHDALPLILCIGIQRHNIQKHVRLDSDKGIVMFPMSTEHADVEASSNGWSGKTCDTCTFP